MLVLTRRAGESILIDGGIRVRVLKANGSRVRIGIEAPDDVRIVREKAGDAPAIGARVDEDEVVAEEKEAPGRKSRVEREAVTRNVGATRPGREGVPAPRQGAGADRHTGME